MQRRDVLAFLGTTVLAPLLSPLSAPERWSLGAALHQRLARRQAGLVALTPRQMATLIALSDDIIPATDTPGAVDAGVPEFIDLLVAEWYGDSDKAEVVRGLDGLDERHRGSTGKGYPDGSPAGRAELLATIDGKEAAPGSLEAAYKRIKSAIVFGYLTSKPIAALTMTTPIIPGRFDGCIPVGSRQ